MSDFAWPTTPAFGVESCSVYLQPNTREFTSQYTGSFQAVDLLGERFRMALRLVACFANDAAAREAYFNRLLGVHRIIAPHLVRPQPLGTQRGTPALSANVLQGASALPMNGGTNGKTFEPGDMLGVGGEWFQVAETATFNGSGLATVQMVNRVRSPGGLSSASAVTWDRPTTTWRLASSVSSRYLQAHLCDAMDLELIQAW